MNYIYKHNCHEISENSMNRLATILAVASILAGVATTSHASPSASEKAPAHSDPQTINSDVYEFYQVPMLGLTDSVATVRERMEALAKVQKSSAQRALDSAKRREASHSDAVTKGAKEDEDLATRSLSKSQKPTAHSGSSSMRDERSTVSQKAKESLSPIGELMPGAKPNETTLIVR